MFSIAFTFALLWSLSLEVFHFQQTEIFYSIIVVSVLSVGLLFTIQIIFNENVFELGPDDFILAALLILSDTM